MSDAKKLARAELEHFENDLERLLHAFRWELGSNEVQYADILTADVSPTNLTDPMVDAMLSTDLNLTMPFVLYLPSGEIENPMEYLRADYTDIETLYDILGAIATHYKDHNRTVIDAIYNRGDIIELASFYPYRDGYKVEFDTRHGY